MAFTGASIVGGFLVGDGHVVTLNQYGPVPGVYPPGFIASITGGVISGDGHVVLGVPSGQFGTPTFTVTLPVVTVGGVPSAQAFGTPNFKTAITVAIPGRGTAQSFGSLAFRVTVGSGGVLTAQAFGVPTIRATITRTVGGVASAQAFGSLIFRTGFTKAVPGLGSAQAFGAVQIVFAQAVQVGGIASAQSFGLLTIKGSIKPTVGGVPSAQAFGQVHLRYPQWLGVAGIGSAQAFGTAAFGFGVWNVWLHDLVCQDDDLAPASETPHDLDPAECLSDYAAITDNPTICGDWLCGETIYSGALDCIDSDRGSLCNEFIVGDGTLVGQGSLFYPASSTVTFDLDPVGCD